MASASLDGVTEMLRNSAVSWVVLARIGLLDLPGGV